jgi:hypothetical protein
MCTLSGASVMGARDANLILVYAWTKFENKIKQNLFRCRLIGRTGVSEASNFRSSRNAGANMTPNNVFRRNARKTKQLGMHHATADRKLRKSLLFKFVCELHYDICFVCKNQITDIDELSIEHKQPWENISAELYWNLDNIAFSHVDCNRAHTYRSGLTEQLKDITPEGQAWCSGHREFLDKEFFTKSKLGRNGLHHYCRGCKKVRCSVKDKQKETLVQPFTENN